ncbi:membrane protein [Streptomyces sp. OV198]|nr:MmpS family membrane protein [Streptomyces sp. Ag82_O1-15]SOE57521.1 membrane protein [Streptomyces sp. OV198]
MSHNQPPMPEQPGWGPVPPQPPTTARPRWARKRVAIPAAIVLLFVGVGIGSSGSDQKATASDKPTPQVTVTKTAEAKPAPTVTVTKTAKPKATPQATPKKEATTSDDAAADGKVVFKVWGSAPSGTDITYGSDSDSRQGSGLPMTKTLTADSDAMYFQVTAQLQGGGDINCSVTVDGQTKKGHASGGYNICSAQLSSDFFGGWS